MGVRDPRSRPPAPQGPESLSLRGKGLPRVSTLQLPNSAPAVPLSSAFISPPPNSVPHAGPPTVMESNLSGLVPAAGLVPALPPAVTLGLTAAYTTLYALLFFSVYAQLWLVLLYGHKRLSYQTVFLALCLLWAALRTTLFSFYFRDTPRANRLGPLPFWLLYCCPVCLQFFTLTLMNLYFAQVTVGAGVGGWRVSQGSSPSPPRGMTPISAPQVVFKAKAKRRPEMSRGLWVPKGMGTGVGGRGQLAVATLGKVLESTFWGAPGPLWNGEGSASSCPWKHFRVTLGSKRQPCHLHGV